MSTATQIIEKFELQVNDLTELATQEELDLLNEVYLADVCSNGVMWEILKKESKGTAITLDSVAGLYYVTVPADFLCFVENNSYTDNTLEVDNNAWPKVIFVGQNRQRYQIVNYSDRQQYRNQSGIAYLDMQANKIYFTQQPSDLSLYSFDYLYTPAPLALGDSPVFPSQFHGLFWRAMAVANEIVQLSPKAGSYAPDNQAKFADLMDKMRKWNANLVNI